MALPTHTYNMRSTSGSQWELNFSFSPRVFFPRLMWRGPSVPLNTHTVMHTHTDPHTHTSEIAYIYGHPDINSHSPLLYTTLVPRVKNLLTLPYVSGAVLKEPLFTGRSRSVEVRFIYSAILRVKYMTHYLILAM